MKKPILFLAFLCIVSQSLWSQTSRVAPGISRPVYFDVSPPLRDMVKPPVTKADRSWKEGAVMNQFDFYAGSGDMAGIPGLADPGLQAFFGMLPSDTTLHNFDGQGNSGGVVPPDTHGEAGMNYYFQVVNLSYAIYNKTGERIFGPMPNSSIWNGMPNNTNSGDAVVLYDEASDRWLFTQFSLPNSMAGPFFQMIAVSQTSDPTGSWYRYEYQFNDMPDYPKFGVWADGYYMSANRFNGGYKGTGMYAYDRDAMLSGNPDAVRISFELPGGPESYSLLPADCDGPLTPAGTPEYFTYVRINGSQHLGMYEFHSDWTTPSNSTLTGPVFLPVNAFSVPSGIPQLGTNVQLETLADRLMYDAKFRIFNGYWSLVLNHTVTASGAAGIRWYELRKVGSSAWSVYQQATYAPSDNNSRWMGSIAIDTAGTIALGFSVSGPNMYPSVHYTGRLKNDPLNTMTIAEKSIIAGGGCQTGIWSGRSRWGDYSGMSVDPACPTTFWFTEEYYAMTSGSQWQTRIGSFTFANVFSASASATPGIICSGDSTQLEAFAYGGSGNYSYAWSSIPAGFNSNEQSPKTLTEETTRYILTSSDGTNTRHDTTQVKVTLPPTAFAGNDTMVCSYLTSIELHGTATNYRGVGWGSSGDGYFTNSNTLDATYFPGPADKASGSVDLVLFVFAVAPCQGSVNSTRHILFDPCTGIRSPSAGTLQVVPNPARDRATIILDPAGQDAVEISITGISGKTVFSGKYPVSGSRFSQSVDLAGLAPGVYIVKVKSASAIWSERLVIL